MAASGNELNVCNAALFCAPTLGYILRRSVGGGGEGDINGEGEVVANERTLNLLKGF